MTLSSAVSPTTVLTLDLHAGSYLASSNVGGVRLSTGAASSFNCVLSSTAKSGSSYGSGQTLPDETGSFASAAGQITFTADTAVTVRLACTGVDVRLHEKRIGAIEVGTATESEAPLPEGWPGSVPSLG